ncbi:MAG: hypothetical protein K2F81_03870 [Ruminococcus sp.]|nr:hypothetical protein [Ruminococcus sp.]
MVYSFNNQRYVYTHGDTVLNFEHVEFKRGTKLSEYPIIGSRIDVAIEGSTPRQLTLSGRFLIKDFDAVNTYIKSNTGQVISSFKLNDTAYSGMILVDGRTELDASKVFGEMVLILRSLA